MFEMRLGAIQVILLLGLAAAAGFCPTASAQNVDALLKKNLDAHGGVGRLKAVQSTKATGTLKIQGVTAPITIIAKRPNLARLEIGLQIGPYIEGYDGQTAWRINSMTGSQDPETISGEEARDILEMSDLDGPLIDYKSKGHKVQLMGKENVEGEAAYKLKLTLKSGEVKYIYLNSRTFLEAKQISKRIDNGTEIEIETYYSDYRPVAGIVVAHVYEERVEGKTVQVTTIEKIVIDGNIDNDLFKMPIKVLAL